MPVSELLMRCTFLFVMAALVGPALSAQGNCSDGTTGAIVSISRAEISSDGNRLQVCYAIEGNPKEDVGFLEAFVVYNGSGLYPDFDNQPIIPDASPFQEPDYFTAASFCLGGPDLCPDYSLQVFRRVNEPPFTALPSVPAEFICIVHDIRDPSQTAGIQVLSFSGVQGNGTAISACPADDQGFYDGALPVDLLSFGATVDGMDVILDWETASETNNAGFEVQTQNGAMWDVLGFLEGHGTTTETQAYSYRVVNVGVGTHVFRLKQIDFDGNFEYFGDIEITEVEATIETPGVYQVASAYPNPFNAQSQFTLAVAHAQQVTVELFNTLGRQIAVLFDGSVEANRVQSVTIDGTELPSGIYVVRVNGERFSEVQRVSLVK